MSKRNNGNRVVVLDTETTGLDAKNGHRIIEVGCVEMRERRLTGNNLHLYLQPDREIDAGAMAVHGISNEFLLDKPRFANVAQQLKDYLLGAELIIHNAPFDIGFLEHEFALCDMPWKLEQDCRITDSLAMARKQFPGQRNNLDALCKRLSVNNSHRTLHGALLDSEILADVYLVMTGGQTAMSLDHDTGASDTKAHVARSEDIIRLPLVRASDEELLAHGQWLDKLRKAPDGCAWDKMSVGQDEPEEETVVAEQH